MSVAERFRSFYAYIISVNDVNYIPKLVTLSIAERLTFAGTLLNGFDLPEKIKTWSARKV